MARSLIVAAALHLALTGGLAAQRVDGLDVRRALMRIESLERVGRLDEARAALDSLLARSPADPGAVLIAERLYREQGELEVFLPIVRRAVRLDPTSALFRQIEMRALGELGRRDELWSAGERWLREMPNSAIAYREFAMVLRVSGDGVGAERVLRRGLGVVDRPAVLASQLADIYLAQHRWSEAAELWTEILLATPGLAWDLLSHKLDGLGPDALPAAAAVLDRAARLEHDGARELVALAALYAQRPDAAREHATAALDRLPSRQDEAFLVRFAKAAAGRGEPALVAWAYRRLLAGLPGDSLRWDLARQVVQYDLSAGDTAEARQILDEFLHGASEGTAAHSWASATRVRVAAAAGDARRASQALDRHARLYPDDPELPHLALQLAAANLRAGRLEEAEGALSLAGDLADGSPVSARAAVLRGYLALQLREHERARAELQVAARRLAGPERGVALRLLSFLQAAHPTELDAVARAHRAVMEERPLEASERLATALKDAPVSAVRPGLLLWAGELALAGGSLERAEPLLRRVFQHHPRAGAAPVALMALAESLAEASRGEEAMTLLERLIIDYPESALTPLARRRLAELRQEVPRS